MQYAYGGFLLLAFLGVLLADFKLKLAVFADPKLWLKVVIPTVLFFLVWDIAGIYLGIFGTDQAKVSGLTLGDPNLPLEELLFLTHFCYITLVAYIFIRRHAR